MAYFKFFFVLTVLTVFHIVQARNSWPETLSLVLNARLEIKYAITSLKCNDFQDLRKLDTFISLLENLPTTMEKFKNVRFHFPEKVDITLPYLLDESGTDMVRSDLFKNNVLNGYYENGMVKLLEKMKDSIHNHLTSNRRNGFFKFPLDEICTDIPVKDPVKDIRIFDICESTQKCSSTPNPYGERSSTDTDVTDACTRNNKCDLKKALPMMIGVFWHAMTNVVKQFLCYNKCAQIRCNVLLNLMKFVQDATFLKAYISTFPIYFKNTWKNNFFDLAVDRRAFSNLNVALTMIEEKKNNFELASVSCGRLEFVKACPYADIYKEFITIKKVQKHRMDPEMVKDLRLESKVDNAKMVALQKDALDQIRILGGIESFDENLQASVSGISSYFTGLAKYDEDIADNDEIYIRGELDKFEKTLANVEAKVTKGVRDLMGLMIGTAIANLAEEIAFLVARIVENCNPLRVIFGGTEIGDILEQSAKVAGATSTVVKASTLFSSLNNLVTDSVDISNAFHKRNRDQITAMKAIVDKIRKNQAHNIGEDADRFMEQYAGYTPMTDRSSLAHNSALWSAFKDAACDIVNSDVGIPGAIPQAVANGMLICEKLEGTLGQYFALREDIFDFQFELVDAIAKVVRGNIAKRLSQNIQGKGDVVDASKLMIGFLMMQARLQTHASMYCDKLEYKQLGESVEACATVKGLFSKDNIDSLIAYTDDSRYDELDREVYIPTKPRFRGDTGYIDLNSLGEGESVVFKLPVDENWLQEYGWTLNGETTVPFVEEFKIYIPNKEYRTGKDQERTTTRIEITSIAGSSVSTIAPNTAPVYILPSGHSKYVTVYEEGYSSCSTEITNPYSLCDNLPAMCEKSKRHAGQSLLPTILSTWNLSFKILKGSQTLKWVAPIPSTNLLIRAKLKLRMLSSKKKRSHLPKRLTRSIGEVRSTNGCCEGNMYRSSVHDRKCIPCPDHSTSYLRGLYCEIDEEPTTDELKDE